VKYSQTAGLMLVVNKMLHWFFSC